MQRHSTIPWCSSSSGSKALCYSQISQHSPYLGSSFIKSSLEKCLNRIEKNKTWKFWQSQLFCSDTAPQNPTQHHHHHSIFNLDWRTLRNRWLADLSAQTGACGSSDKQGSDNPCKTLTTSSEIVKSFQKQTESRHIEAKTHSGFCTNLNSRASEFWTTSILTLSSEHC